MMLYLGFAGLVLAVSNTTKLPRNAQEESCYLSKTYETEGKTFLYTLYIYTVPHTVQYQSSYTQDKTDDPQTKFA
jgi:hypothetical protein